MKNIQRLLSILLLLGVASCVQIASDEVAPTQVGNILTYTPTATVTETSPPTEPPTEMAISVETEDIVEPTDPALPGFATETPIPSATPTDTPTPTATLTPTATSTATATPTAAVSGLVQPEGQDDVIPPVNQQEGGQNNQVTDFELTATALITGATATQSFIETQIAIEQGIGVDQTSEDPTPDPANNQAQADAVLTQQAQQTAAALAVVQQPGADCVHEVRAVDRSLYRLSLAYGVTVNQIATASGIVNPDLIRVGQRLTIPGCGTTGGRPAATSTPDPNNLTGTGGFVGGTAPINTDCTWGTSVIFPGGCPGGTNLSGNVGQTDPNAVAGTGGPVTSAFSGQTVRVEQGETLFEISLRTGIPVANIAAANGITNYDLIYLNQELVIP